MTETYKSEYRKAMRAKLRAFPETYIESSDQAIFEKVISLPEYVSARGIYLYYSIRREVDTIRLIKQAMADGKHVYLPVTYGEGRMEFTQLTCGLEQLTYSALGIPEPDATAPVSRPGPEDIMIVPAVSFDREGYRLGQGGGYYDRYLEKSPIFTVGLCRVQMLSEAVPREPHDISVRCLITEEKIARL